MLKTVAEIRDPVHGYVKLTEVERQLADSRFLQRLRSIHQLAGSYLVYPGAVHTRFEHVVGTMHVAGQILDALSRTFPMSKEEVEEVRMASLLHDVGHGPFSHTFEEVLAENGGATHEDMSQRIVRETELAEVIDRQGYSSKKLSELAVGRGSSVMAFRNEIIAGGMSADMMDYLRRDSYFTGVEYGLVDTQRVIDSLRVGREHLILDEAALQAFEALLLARYEMFKAVYFHRTVRAAELMLVSSMKLADDALGLTDLSSVDKYLDLTDEVVLHDLMKLTPSSADLREARKLAVDFRERRLLKCVFEKTVQRKDEDVGRIMADEAARERVRSEIASRSKVDPAHVFIDVSTTPSVPFTSSKQALTAITLLKAEGGGSVMENVPIDALPLVGSISGYMDMVRVYTNERDRTKVGKASSSVLGGVGVQKVAEARSR